MSPAGIRPIRANASGPVFGEVVTEGVGCTGGLLLGEGAAGFVVGIVPLTGVGADPDFWRQNWELSLLVFRPCVAVAWLTMQSGPDASGRSVDAETFPSRVNVVVCPASTLTTGTVRVLVILSNFP